MGRCLQPEVPDGLEHHGQQVDHVEGAEDGQQLIEEARQLLPGEQEYRGNVPCGVQINVKQAGERGN